MPCAMKLLDAKGDLIDILLAYMTRAGMRLLSALLLTGIADGTPVAPMADSQAWPQPATQVPLDDLEADGPDAAFDDGGDGLQDDSDGDNGYQAGSPPVVFSARLHAKPPDLT